MATLTEILFILSNWLLIPVVLALLLLAATTTLQLGGFVAEAFVRWWRRRAFAALVRDLKATPDRTVRLAKVPARFGLPARALRELRATIDSLDKTLDDLQLESERLLGRLSLGIRLGPVLGLAGTLIPLGPALMALSTGDFNTLSTRLVVAFTTTVIGLIVGGTCFAIYTVRRAWYMQDLNDIEFIAGRIATHANHSTTRQRDSRPAARSGQPV